MGRRGPAPLPTKLKLLHGETRPSRLNAYPAQPAPHAPVKPADLGEAATVVWDRVMAEQAPSIICAAHTDILHAYCEAVVRHDEAVRLLARSGLLIRGARGQELVRNPLLAIVHSEADLMRLYARELGLTPSSVSAFPDRRPAEDDGMAALLTPRRSRGTGR